MLLFAAAIFHALLELAERAVVPTDLVEEVARDVLAFTTDRIGGPDRVELGCGPFHRQFRGQSAWDLGLEPARTVAGDPRWRDEEALQVLVASPAFAHGHAGTDRLAPHGGPVSVASELWFYGVAGRHLKPPHVLTADDNTNSPPATSSQRATSCYARAYGKSEQSPFQPHVGARDVPLRQPVCRGTTCSSCASFRCRCAFPATRRPYRASDPLCLLQEPAPEVLGVSFLPSLTSSSRYERSVPALLGRSDDTPQSLLGSFPLRKTRTCSSGSTNPPPARCVSTVSAG